MRRQISNSKYGTLTLTEIIGKGSYGSIYKATASKYPYQQTELAVKVIVSDSDPDTLPNIQKQIKILMSCQHPNIIQCFSVEVVEQSVWIVMEYCQLGSLSDIMNVQEQGFTEQQIRNYLTGIILALSYLHDNRIVHRDIKAANVLLTAGGQVKVADFGVSTLLTQTMAGRNTRTGSPFWMSPELLSKSRYSFKTDIWSLGITAIELAEGVPPYSHQHPYRAIFSIQSRPPNSLTAPKNWSIQFNKFVSDCLTLNQEQRPSADELLRHPFIQGHGNKISINQREMDIFNNKKMMDASSFQSYGRNLDQSPSNTGRQEHEQNNFGTVVIRQDLNNEESFSKILTKNYHEDHQRKAQQTIEQDQQIKGVKTFEMRACILQSSEGSMKIKKNHQNEKQAISQIDRLYQEMETEIVRVRMKYLKQIKQVEQRSLPSFEESLEQQLRASMKVDFDKQNYY